MRLISEPEMKLFENYEHHSLTLETSFSSVLPINRRLSYMRPNYHTSTLKPGENSDHVPRKRSSPVSSRVFREDKKGCKVAF